MTNILIRDIEKYAVKNKIKQKNLKKMLNLNFTDVTCRNYNIGKYDLPYISAKIPTPPDYIALYNEKDKYYATNSTCISFFKDIKYFIAPDYSL